MITGVYVVDLPHNLVHGRLTGLHTDNILVVISSITFA